MSIKIKAKEQLQYVGNHAGEYAYVMTPETYSKLSAQKVIQEAALRSGLPRGAINASWDAIGAVITAWATEGHSVAIPGLGTMRFGLRAKAATSVNDVSTGLITSRRVVFTPSTEIKSELANTGITITCYDRNGNEVKRVNSSDSGDIEDPENDGSGS